LPNISIPPPPTANDELLQSTTLLLLAIAVDHHPHDMLGFIEPKCALATFFPFVFP